MNRRVGRLERHRKQRQGAHEARHDRDEEELYRDCDNPEVFIRYDRALERERAAFAEAEAEDPGGRHSSAKVLDAEDEVLRAREELREYSRRLRDVNDEEGRRH